MTFNYEGFRNTLPGWFLVAVVAFIALPYLDLTALTTSQTVALIVVGLISSQVTGYVITQVVRAWQDWRHTRPNNTQILVASFAEECRAISHGKGSQELLALVYSLALHGDKASDSVNAIDGAKDLHRYLWVTLANKDLRDRSESYWERHSTNVNLMVAMAIGVPIGLTSAFESRVLSFTLTDWGWFAALEGTKLLGLSFVWLALRKANKEYLRIARGIENAWIRVLLAKIRTDPTLVRLF